MMNWKRMIFWLWLPLLLCSCVAGGRGDGEDRSVLQQQLQALPGAVVDLQTLSVSYPADVLYAGGSALPYPGGMDLLEPLLDLLLKTEGMTAVVTLRSSGNASDYDRTLAERRRTLLERLLQNRGVPAERLQMQSEAGPGAPLEVRFQESSSATSSGGNS